MRLTALSVSLCYSSARSMDPRESPKLPVLLKIHASGWLYLCAGLSFLTYDVKLQGPKSDFKYIHTYIEIFVIVAAGHLNFFQIRTGMSMIEPGKRLPFLCVDRPCIFILLMVCVMFYACNSLGFWEVCIFWVLVLLLNPILTAFSSQRNLFMR